MWMPLVARSFPQRTVLVIYQHQKSHMGATKTSFQRLDEVRNRQQLLCAIHLRHVGPFDFAAGILNHKLYALQERKPKVEQQREWKRCFPWHDRQMGC